MVGLVAMLGCWWGGVAISGISPFFLPAPPDIVDAFLTQAPYLLLQTWITVWHMGAGFILAAGLGIGLAVVLSALPWLRDATLPWIISVQAVPKVVLAPLMIVWFGYGHTAKIVMAFLVSCFPVVLASHAGLRATPVEILELARSLTAPRWQVFAKIRIRYALPHIFIGLKLAVLLALIGAVVGQMTNPTSGLGAVATKAIPYANMPLALAATVACAAIGIGGFGAIVALERLCVPWARETTG